MATWNIYNADGQYIAQAQAVNAEAAFCQYMALFTQTLIMSSDITAKEIEPGVCEIKHKGETFIVRK
jgi:hypothetical protein